MIKRVREWLAAITLLFEIFLKNPRMPMSLWKNKENSQLSKKILLREWVVIFMIISFISAYVAVCKIKKHRIDARTWAYYEGFWEKNDKE